MAESFTDEKRNYGRNKNLGGRGGRERQRWSEERVLSVGLMVT